MDCKKIKLLSQMAENIFSAESQLRKMRNDLITSILRENGGNIVFSYRTLGILYDNCWHDVERIVLVNNEDYEVYCIDRLTGELIDIEEIERYDISGDNTYYGSDNLLELLCEIIKKAKVIKV